MAEEDVKDWSKSSVAELKEELNVRQLLTTGLKKDLVKRLQDDDVIQAESCENAEGDISAEDVVDDVIEEIEANAQENDDEIGLTETTDEIGNCEGADIVEAEELAEQANADLDKPDAETKDNDAIKEDETAHDDSKQDDDQLNDDEEEELNMEDMVAVDETHDDEDEEVEEELDVEKLLKGDDDDMIVLPPVAMNKWIWNNFVTKRSTCTLYISKLTAKDVLCASMVEWSNRAVFFCINHDRKGHGCAMLNYSTIAECEEAKDALQKSLGEEVTITNPTSKMDKEVKTSITFQTDSGSLMRSRLVFVEGAPKETTIEEMCGLFDESLSIIKLNNEEPVHKWEKQDYAFPEEMQNLFVLEFSSTEAVANIIKTEKEIGEQKLIFKTTQTVEEDYKRLYARKLREARDKKWELFEEKKKEELVDCTLTDDERFKLYRDISAMNKYKKHLMTSKDKLFDHRVLAKETIIVKLFETRQKIDGDTNRRLKAGLMLPELERFMTKYTLAEYNKLSSDLRKKMQKEALDPFPINRKNRSSSSHGRHDRERHDHHGGRDRRPIAGRNRERGGRGGGDRQGGRDRGGPHRPDRMRSDRGREQMGRRDFRGGRRDMPGRGDRSVWRSPERMDMKRRRMDDMGDRRGGGMEVANTLKGLTDVINHKMNEIERLAGGMKARERALEEAFQTIATPGSRSVGGGSFQNMGGGGGFSGMGYNSGGNYMSQQSGGYSSGSGGSSGRYQGNMSRSGMQGSSLDRRRNNDVDDRFSRF